MKTEIHSHPFDQLLAIDKRCRGRAYAAPVDMEQSIGIEGWLALRLGSWNLMFYLNELTEIISVPLITRVPGVNRWLMGIANLRGTTIAIVDLNRFLSNAPTVPATNSRIVIFRSGEWFYGLLVDEIIGMRHFDSEDRMASLAKIENSIRPYLIEGYRSEGKEWLVFSVDRLRRSAKFLGQEH